MFYRGLPALCLCFFAATAGAQATTDAATPGAQATTDAAAPDAHDAPVAPEKVLVVGQRPGPGLWKISKGEHVLWVFGTYAPLPKKLEWRSQQVENIVAHSQAYLLPPSISASVGFFRGLTLLPQFIGLKNSPDGKTLRDLLPDEVYARWLPIRDKYFGKGGGIERERPFFVANELYDLAIARAGLTTGNEVWEVVDRIAKKNHVKVVNPGIHMTLADPGKAIKAFKSGSMDDLPCFTATLARVETDVDAMRERANAWAKGDIAEIKSFDYAERERACNSAMDSSGAVKSNPEFQAAPERMRAAWIAAAETALENNASTFAILPMHNVLGDKSLVAALQAKGYQVDAPQ